MTAATTTLQHVLDAIQAVAPGRLSAVIDPDTLNSLLLTDALDGGGRLTVTPLNSSAAAFDLGILGAEPGRFSSGSPSATSRWTCGSRLATDRSSSST